MGGSNSTSRKAAYKSLVTAKDLSAELFEPGATAQQFKLKKDITKKIRVIDATFDGKAREGFLQKSIPTSTLLDVLAYLKDPTARFPNTFPSADHVKDLMGNMGVNKNDHIVLYGQVGSISGPTRAHFILSTYGFPNIKILQIFLTLRLAIYWIHSIFKYKY